MILVNDDDDDCLVLTDDGRLYHKNYHSNILIDKQFILWKIYKMRKMIM